MALADEHDTGANGAMEQAVAVLEPAVARETEEEASYNRGARSTTLVLPSPDPRLHCQVWARLHECEHQSESMHKLCRPACKVASSGHMPLLDYSLEALLLLDVAASQEQVTFAPELGRALCQISQLMDGKNWAISRPAGGAFAPFDSTLHTMLTVLCVKYEDRKQGDGPTLIKSNTRSGIPRVMNPIGRATRGEALGSYEYIAQSLACVLGCVVVLLLLLGQSQRAKVLRSQQPKRRRDRDK